MIHRNLHSSRYNQKKGDKKEKNIYKINNMT